jgi:hypothetical protein
VTASEAPIVVQLAAGEMGAVGLASGLRPGAKVDLTPRAVPALAIRA